MEPHRHFCFDICNHLVNKYHEECGTFVSCTVTNDKTLIHHYKPECKCQEYGMKTPDVTSLKEVQIPTNIGKSFVNNVLEFASNNPWVLSGMGCYNKQCMLQWDASWQAKAGGSEKMPRTIVKRCYPAGRQCSFPYCCPLLKYTSSYK